MRQAHSVIYFDGVCNLCNRAVAFLIRNDKQKVFRFASLQGEAGMLLIKSQPHLQQLDSLVLQHRGKVFTQSTAALHIARLLGFPLNLLVVFFLIPAFLRNAIYRIVAGNRYRWFGKSESCVIASGDMADRFLK